MMTDEGDLSALDVPALVRWLGVNGVPEASRVRIDPIGGGQSNLTYRLVLPDGRQWALRRPPGGLTPHSAHDVLREHRVLTALQDTAVPVPRTRGSNSGDVLGVPFYVMDFVDGMVLTSPRSVQTWSEASRHRVGIEMIDALATLHDLDPASVGLADLGRPTGYVERQLLRWHQQWTTGAERDLPVVDQAFERLQATRPEMEYPALVHGDYHLSNCVVGEEGNLRAVLDWEMSTQGDAVADLAMMMMYWGRDEYPPVTPASPSELNGFAERRELCDRYQQLRGFELPDLNWYLALANWKFACIVEGVLSRVVHGAMGDPDRFDMEWLRRTPAERADIALDLLGDK